MSEAIEEANKACLIARQAWERGDKEKALKFIRKSIRLCPTDEAKGLCTYYEHSPSPSATRPTQSRSPPTSPTSASKAPAYTQEQESFAQIIVNSTNYYNIMRLDRSATAPQIKSAFRKLAVKIHPDKNQAPSAEEAFKKVNQAYQCLSDERKKRRYDQTGEDTENVAASSSHRTRTRHRHSNEEDTYTTEDIFDELFGGGRRRRRTRQPRGDRTEKEQEQGLHQFSQLLPLIFVVLVSLLSALGSTDAGQTSLDPGSLWSLKREGHFSVSRSTNTPFSTQYFVQKSFKSRVASDFDILHQVETSVDDKRYQQLNTDCKKELQQKNKLVNDAKKAPGVRRNNLLKKAYTTSTRSCETLQSILAF